MRILLTSALLTAVHAAASETEMWHGGTLGVFDNFDMTRSAPGGPVGPSLRSEMPVSPFRFGPGPPMDRMSPYSPDSRRTP